jgi:pyruvate/2-oxoglutarate/acetoin dehydrogenase E1 component
MVVEKAFDWLDAPVIRVGGRDVPMPYNDELERWVIPTTVRITDAIREVFQP